MIKKNGQLRYQHIRKQKMTPTQIPQGGWGLGSTEPTQTCFLLLFGYNASTENALWSLLSGIQRLTICKRNRPS